MPELQTTIEFEVECTAHPTVRLDVDIRKRRGIDIIYIEPCQLCIEDAIDEDRGSE